MLKKLFIIFAFLFMASSTAFADGIVPVICSMEEFNYCKDIKKIIEYTPEGYYNNKPDKIYAHGHYNTIIELNPEYEIVKRYAHGHYNTIIELNPEYEIVKRYAHGTYNTIREYTPEGYRNHEPVKIYALIKY